MTLTLTMPIIIFIISLLTGWTAFLLTAIKWLLNRQLIGIETKIAEAEKRASEALTGLNHHKESTARDLASVRLEFSQKSVCNNHPRMEADNTVQFATMNKLSGNIQKLDGKIDSLINSMDLLMTHHISGGR
jgi:phage shock protein A